MTRAGRRWRVGECRGLAGERTPEMLFAVDVMDPTIKMIFYGAAFMILTSVYLNPALLKKKK